MSEHKGILKAVAKTGGLKLDGEDEWWNASIETKQLITGGVLSYQKLIGKNIILKINEQGYYTELVLDAIQTNNPPNNGPGFKKQQTEYKQRTHPEDEKKIVRMNCLTQANSLVSNIIVSKSFEKADVDIIKELVLVLAGEFENWVNR